MSPQGRTSYKHEDTRESLHLLDGQIGFRKKERIDPLLKALILERATELSSQKAGRVILPQNQELTVSPEVVKRLVHHLRKDEEKEGKISEKRQKPAKKRFPRHRKRRGPCPPEGEEERRKRKKEEIQNPCQTRLHP
jgi:hypothetical protein